MKYDFIILTTAMTRPDLHAQLSTGNLRFIGCTRVKWIVNMDPLDNGVSISMGIDHFRSLYATAPNIDLEFHWPERCGCFFSATKRLAARAYELMDECRTGVLWLEDDWQFTNGNPLRTALQRTRALLARMRRTARAHFCPGVLSAKQKVLDALHVTGCSYWYLALVPRTAISFNPGIWSKAMFLQAFCERLGRHPDSEIDDPETLCADPFNTPDAYRAIEILIDPVYQDAGRLWKARAGLLKWTKDPGNLTRRGSVGYVSQIGRPDVVDSTGRDG